MSKKFFNTGWGISTFSSSRRLCGLRNASRWMIGGMWNALFWVGSVFYNWEFGLGMWETGTLGLGGPGLGVAELGRLIWIGLKLFPFSAVLLALGLHDVTV